MVVLCLISADLATCSQGWHKHMVNVIVSKLNTVASFTLSPLLSMLFSSHKTRQNDFVFFFCVRNITLRFVSKSNFFRHQLVGFVQFGVSGSACSPSIFYQFFALWKVFVGELLAKIFPIFRSQRVCFFNCFLHLDWIFQCFCTIRWNTSHFTGLQWFFFTKICLQPISVQENLFIDFFRDSFDIADCFSLFWH